MWFLDIIFNFIRFFVKFLGNTFIVGFNFFVKFKDIVILFYMVSLRFFLFISLLLFDVLYKFLFYTYKFLVYYVLYFYNYIVIRIKTLKLIVIKFDTYNFTNYIKKYKIRNFFYNTSVISFIYYNFFNISYFSFVSLKYILLFFKKYFFIFLNTLFVFSFYISSLLINFLFKCFIYFKQILNFISIFYSNIKYLFFLLWTSLISFTKNKLPFLYKFLLFSRLGYLLAVFYIYLVILFPLLQNYENILFLFQFNNIGENFFWYGNLIDINVTTSKGWFSNVYDAGDFFLLKIFVTIFYFIIFIPYFRNVWFKEEDWETTFVDSEFDNDEIMEEEDDFDESYVEDDNMIQQGEEVNEYYDELRGKALVRARINNFTYANGHLISNDYGWGFFITFWIFTFYYSIKLFFWPNFLFLPYASLFNLHAKSTMYGSIIPFMENYIHSNLFINNNWVPSTPMKHSWYHKNYNHINVALTPEELFWNRPRNYNWANWNDIYSNFSDKFYYKKKPRFGNLEGGARRFSLHNPLVNLGFLDYNDYRYMELSKDRKRHMDRYDSKKMYGVIDVWNEVYATYPIVDKNINFWKRSVFGFRNQLNIYYNNGYNFLNYWPKKEGVYGLLFGLDIENFTSKQLDFSFQNINSKSPASSHLKFNNSNFALDYLYINFIYKRDIPDMPLSYDFADRASRIKPLQETTVLLLPQAAAPYYTHIPRMTILPFFRRMTMPISYDYGLDSLELDKNLAFWLFFNNSIIYNQKSSLIFFDLMNYMEKNYKDSFYRKIFLKLWYEYKEGKFSVSLLNNYVYPIDFFDMQHSPYNFKFNSVYEKLPDLNKEAILEQKISDLGYFYKTRFFNPLDPKWAYPLWYDIKKTEHMNTLWIKGSDFPKEEVEKNAFHGYIMEPHMYYMRKKDVSYYAMFTRFWLPKISPHVISKGVVFRDIYPFDYKNYSNNFNDQNLKNRKFYSFDTSASFVKNFFNGTNVELPSSKQTGFINYYNKYFSRKEGNVSNLLDYQISQFPAYKKRKEFKLNSLFDFFFNLRTMDVIFSDSLDLDEFEENTNFSFFETEKYNFSDVTRGFRQLPFLFFEEKQISTLKKTSLTSLTQQSLAKENFMNLHLVYLRYLSFNTSLSFSDNFSNMLQSSEIFFDWFTDYFYYVLGPEEKLVSNLPYQFYMDITKGILYKKEEIILLEKFTLFQAPYSNVFLVLKMYNFILNSIVFFLESIQNFINQIYAFDIGLSKRTVMNFLNLIFLSIVDVSNFDYGYFFIYNDNFYNFNYKYQILNDFQSYNTDFFYEVDLKEISSNDSHIAVPYALKSLSVVRTQEVLDFFLNNRNNLYNTLYNENMEKNQIISNYIPLLKGYFLYDILLSLEKLKNTASNNKIYFTFSAFSDDFSDSFLESQILLNYFKINKYYLNDFWLGDAQTWFFLTYDSRFLGLSNPYSLSMQIFLQQKNIV